MELQLILKQQSEIEAVTNIFFLNFTNAIKIKIIKKSKGRKRKKER